MNQQAIQVLAQSEDPTELGQAAIELASEGDAQAIGVLVDHLADDRFLERLDTPEDYQASAGTLRVAQVVKELGRNPAPETPAVFARLTQSESFNRRLVRREVLIAASSAVSPPPTELLQYWRDNSVAGDTSTPLVIRAVIENGTDAAAEIFEAKLLDPAEDPGDKSYWLLFLVVPNRNQPALLRCAERLFSSSLSDELKQQLEQVIFEYDPAWYKPSSSASPPKFAPGEEACVLLERIRTLRGR